MRLVNPVWRTGISVAAALRRVSGLIADPLTESRIWKVLFRMASMFCASWAVSRGMACTTFFSAAVRLGLGLASYSKTHLAEQYCVSPPRRT
jgi:hypothetical protein